MGLIPCWETGSRQPCAGDVYAGGEELPETPIEKGPHTVLKGISGKVTRGSNSTSPILGFLKVVELRRYVLLWGLFMFILL